MKKIFLLTILSTVLASPVDHRAVAQSYRDSWQQPEKIMDVVGVVSGMVIGEAGAGAGYFTFFLAERVGEKGKVYANDILRHQLDVIDAKCESEGIDNIVTILGEVDDPLFPPGELDMVIVMLALHEFTQPVDWMRNVVPSMKAGAKLVIVERDPERTNHGLDHFMTRAEVLSTMAKTAFALERIETFLERDNIYVYSSNRELNR